MVRVAYLLLAIVYVVSGKLGLLLALPPGYASPIFVPAGIAVAAAFISGRKPLPWIFLGSLVLNIWIGYSASHQINPTGLTAAFLIAVASTLQAALGGWVLRRVVGYPAGFDHSAEILRFLLLSPLICLTSATLSVTCLWALSIFDTTNSLSNWASWWVGDTLGVLIMLPLAMIVAGEPRALWRSRKFTVAVPMLLIFATFIGIYLRANQWEYSDSLSDFRLLSQQTVNQVKNKLEEQEFLLEQTAGLFNHDLNGKVTRAEFHRFVLKSLSRFPMIQALEWAPEVDAAQRANFEATQRKDFPGFEIRNRNVDGQLQRAGNRDYFFPVTYIEPLATNETALGFDLASTPERLEALNKAKRSGNVVISAKVKLVQERQHQLGVLMLLTVNPQDNKSAVVLTVLRLGDFMDKLLVNMHPMLFTRLIDLDDQTTIYDNFETNSSHSQYENEFEFGTRHYRLETAPTNAYIAQHRGWQSWSVLAAGVLGTSLLGTLLLLGTGYTARMEAQVEDRTRKLKVREEELNEAQHIGRIGSWDWEAATDTVTCSAECYLILGHDPTKPLPNYEDHLKLYTEESAGRLDAAVKRSIQFGEGYELDLELVSTGGIRRWLTARSKVKQDATGSFAGLSGTLTDITRRKFDEESLLKQKQFSDDVINYLPGIFYMLNERGDIFRSNSQLSIISGYTNEEIGRMNALDFFDAKDKDAVSNSILEAFDKGDATIEVDLLTKSGQRIPHRFTGHLTIIDGRPFIVGLGADISSRKRAEQALQSENEKNYALLRNASDGIHILDSNGYLLEASDSFCSMLGYPREELIGKHVSQWDAKLSDTDLALALNKLLTSRSRTAFETRHRCKDGAIIDVEISTMALELNEKPVLINSSRDITERKQMDKALRESEARFKTISENELVGIVISKDRIIQWANPAYEKILGYEKGELIGASSRLIFYSEDEYQKLGENAYPVMNSGKVYRTEIRYRHKNGSPIFVDVSGGNLNLGVGQTIWSCVDISERVKSEIELKRSNTELEQFSYVISHDMRQPLRMISSYLQLIQMNLIDKLDTTNREYFDFAIDGAKRMDQMLVGLLDYSRVGRKNDPFAWVESRAMLDEATLFLGPATSEAKANIIIEGDWPRVWVSRDEIVRLFQNLIGNAVKYRTQEKAPQIYVISKVINNHWRVQVVDNGIGIDPNQLGRLFQVFQRLQSRANFEGNGIGLALCRRIIEHHGGRIWAESAGENQGSTFSFEISQEHK